MKKNQSEIKIAKSVIMGLQLNKLRVQSLQGKIFLLVISFFAILSFLVLAIFLKNLQGNQVGSKMQNVKTPLTMAISNMIQAIDESGSLQRDVIINKDASVIAAKQKLWDEKINPLSEKVYQLSEFLDKKSQQQVDSFKILLVKYEKLSKSWDEIAGSNNDYLPAAPYMGDSLDSAIIIKFIQDVENSKASLISKKDIIDNQLKPLLAELSTLLIPLRNEQFTSLEADMDLLGASAQGIQQISIAISVIGILLALAIAFLIHKSLKKSITHTTRFIDKLAEGELPESVEKRKNELDEIIGAGISLKSNLSAASNFAINIGEGNFESEFKPVGENDALGNALVQMRDKLQDIAEEDKRRNWATEGLAQFGELLREQDNDFKEFGEKITSSLVKYLGANQCALFVLNSTDKDDIYLELLATYAFSKKKYATKKLKIEEDFGEGLAGQAFLEGETIYLTDIPDDYVEITSGLGEALPTSLLIVPLKVNEKVEGVIELASFHKFEEYQIEFIEKLGETIASAVSSAKIKGDTTVLLENAQQQTEMMRAQEEEMRQNLEELATTQEEMKRRSTELENLLEASKENEEMLMAVQEEALEQQRIDEEEIQSLQKFAFIVERATDLVAVVSPSGKISYLNEVGKKQIGENFDKSSVTELFPDKFSEKILGEFLPLALKGEDVRFITKRKSGDAEVDCETIIRVLESDSEDDNLRLSVIIRDDTPTIFTSEEESKVVAVTDSFTEKITGAFYRLEFSPKSGIFSFTYFSDNIQNLIGFSPSELYTLNYDQMLELIHPEDKPAFMLSLQKMINDLTPFEWTGRWKSKEDSWGWFKLSAHVEKQDQKITSEGIMIDVSVLKSV